MIKSAEEIALIKIGAQVADLGGAACVAAIAEDVPEYDVALAATSAMTRKSRNACRILNAIPGRGFSLA
jgi:creatinase